MSALKHFDSYYVKFTLTEDYGSTSCTTNSASSVAELQEDINRVESLPVEIDEIIAREGGTFGRKERFDLDELRSPVLD